MDLYDKIADSTAFLKQYADIKPRIALILGSGMGGIVSQIHDATFIDYKDIPHFDSSSAPTHVGRLVFGSLAGRDLVCMQGRLHLYEGHSPESAVFPVFAMHAMGAQTLIMTNASGAIRPDLSMGDIVAITDHINFTGQVPFSLETALPSQRQVVSTFPDMTAAYSPTLIAKAHQAARTCDIPLAEGVYIGTHGPQFETPAEIRAFGIWGADVVGMSTVLEAITASALRMDLLCLSYVSNKAAGLSAEGISIDDIFRASEAAAAKIARLLDELIPML